MTSFDDIINFLASVAAIISIPLAYLQLSNSKYEKALQCLAETARKVIVSLKSSDTISLDRIQVILASTSHQFNISNKLIIPNEIIREALIQIENNPYIENTDKIRLIERLISLKTNKTSSGLKTLEFWNTNKKNILIITAIAICVIVLLNPSKWKIFTSIRDHYALLVNIGIGIVVCVAIFIIIYFIRRLFYGNIFEGEIYIDPVSFRILPNYYNGKLIFQSGNQSKIFYLDDINISFLKEYVESDPGCLGFGILKFYKIFQSFTLSFNDGNNSKLIICIRKQSIRNGSIDFDYLKYTLYENDKQIDIIGIQVPNGHLIDTKNKEFGIFNIEINSTSNEKSYKSENGKILADSSKRISGIYWDSQFWKHIE